MAVIKCKICGGSMIISPDKTMATCEYCGNVETLTRISEDQRSAMLNRGAMFRKMGEFDKAVAVYEDIVRENDADAEAHWYCALSRFGIEYVGDEASDRAEPTFCFLRIDSFLEDVDYLAAINYADAEAKQRYTAEAVRIAEVQRGVIAASRSSEPWDVFVCCTESDAADAQMIVSRLSGEGLKVFFDRVPAFGRTARECEPGLFAALCSAGSMIVCGSAPASFASPWVRNEWSRFLSMMRKQSEKLLFPCFRSMRAADLPEQLSVLRSYDLSRPGALPELAAAVKKNAGGAAEGNGMMSGERSMRNSAVAPLLKRIRLFASAGDWEKADEYCEKVLDADPECAEAYFFAVVSGFKLGRVNTAYGSQLERLSDDVPDDAFEIISQASCCDYICLFAHAGAYKAAERVMIRFPEFHTYEINYEENRFNSILSFAAIYCFDLKLIGMMLDHGANPNALRVHSSGDIIPVLSDAVWNNKSIELLRLLLDHGADPQSRRVHRDGTVVPVASDAVWNVKNLDMLSLILGHKGDPNAFRSYRNKFGESRYSLLSDAVWNARRRDMVRMLLESGADPNRVEKEIFDDGSFSVKSMVTYAAVIAKDAEMLRLLFKYGANLNSEITLDGITKVERKYPYHKKSGIPDEVISVLRENGWRGNSWF